MLNMRSKRFLLIISILGILVLLAVFLQSSLRRSLKNFTDPGGPVYVGDYVIDRPDFDGTLRVVTWNISFSRKIDEAIETLREVEQLKDADILLLQEMDAEGVEQIAKALKYDYVYYPASIHRRHGKEFGEAILSKWPILSHAKIVLPNSVPVINQTRIVVKANIIVDGLEIAVFNTHLETVWMLQMWGDTQVDYLAEIVGMEDGSLILGGDFNTWSKRSIATLEERFGAMGLKRVSAGTGYTFVYRGWMFIMDHIFTRVTSEYEAGVWHGTNVSDHYPVWAILKL